ncbi:MAG: hypothetical protein ACLRVQ_05515, partial [Lachnospiraceae bacterium]
DVFSSVTKDESKIYMKLVNADNYSKPVKVVIKDTAVLNAGKTITVTGPLESAHTPNINEKNNEVIVPVEGDVIFKNGEAVITLPANSVVAVIADIK